MNQLGFTGGFFDMLWGRQTLLNGQPTMPNMNDVIFKSADGKQYTFQDFMDKGVLPQLGLQNTQLPNLPLPQMSGIQSSQSPTNMPMQIPQIPQMPTMTTTNMPTRNPQNSQNGIPVPIAQDGSLNWDKTTLTNYAAGSGFQTFTPTSGNLNETIGVKTEGKTAEQIANFTNEAQKYGIVVTDNKNGTLTLEDQGWRNPSSNTNFVANRTSQQMPQYSQMPQQVISGTLNPVGIPANLPKTLLSPLNTQVSSQAARKPVRSDGQIYYRPEQELSFQSTGNKYYDSLILGAARTHGINPNLLRAQFYQESGFKKNAMSNKGAGGIGQLMPGTAGRVGVTNRFDPAQSIYGGAKYMRYVTDFMVAKGNVQDGNRLRTLSLAGYNAGEGAVQKYGFNVPNYKETQDYVSRITGNVDTIQRQMPRTNSMAIRQDLGRYDKPTGEIMSKTYSANFEMTRGLQRNALDLQASNQITRASYAEKRNITAANMQMQYQIADNYAAMQQQGAYINTVAQMKAAGINYATETQQAQIGYTGAIASANTIYEGQAKSAIIMAEAQMKAARLRALSGAIQSVGQTVGHQFSEAFEKFNRF